MDIRKVVGLSVPALTAASCAQVTLPSGVTVPKERFIVYIVVGNSEAEGQTTVRSNSPYRYIWDSTHVRLWNFNVQDNHNPAPNHAWIPAKGKNHAGSLAAYPEWLGPEMPLLKGLIAQYSSEYYTLTQRLREATNSDLPLLFACPAGDYATCVEGGRRCIWDKLNAQLTLIPTLATPGTSTQITGLLQQTSYVFTVRARDAAGNVSAASSPLTVTTGTPVAFPFKVNVGGPTANGYLADRLWDGQGYGYST